MVDIFIVAKKDMKGMTRKLRLLSLLRFTMAGLLVLTALTVFAVKPAEAA